MKEIISNCKHNAKYLISIFPVVKNNFPPVFRGMAWPLISHDSRHLAVKISCGLPRESASFNQSGRALYRNFIKARTHDASLRATLRYEVARNVADDEHTVNTRRSKSGFYSCNSCTQQFQGWIHGTTL